jgi:hypothetical protein
MLRFNIIIVSVLIIASRCNEENGTENSKTKEKTLINYDAIYDSLHEVKKFTNTFNYIGEIEQKDSVILSWYLAGKFSEITKKKPELVSDELIGLVVVSYLRQGKLIDAFNAIKNFNYCGFKVSKKDSTVYFPKRFPSSVGDYEKWAIFRVFQANKIKMRFEEQQDLLKFEEFSLQIDTVKGKDVIKLDYFLLKNKMFKGKNISVIEYLDSLIRIYPYWKDIESYKDSIYLYTK